METEIIQITATATEAEGPVVFGINKKQEVCEWNYITGKWEVYKSND